ncbi:hypothetical protein PV08_07955 [Exophiala spinifera]|uniref:Alpha/beta hydrolase fold-3 domain-containing protein n=1 Tax=Exophiala spinifera TaxID=91928 RepID=A0A0D2B1G2_9EURO|nr:uncharacterized protein PV08_07955 [Exophiala spinifera]KIW12768.1 hypothetical protein PV08_07955 [Exophiala spinifera]
MGLTIELSPCSEDGLAARKAFNQRLEAMTNSQIQWHQCRSPQEYRDKRREGTDGFQKPFVLDTAEVISIPSTHAGHQIQLRLIKPAGEIQGVILHYHGGGLVYGSADGQDKYLLEFATDLSLAVASVEYRLAPEEPFPAAGEDALDALRFALSEEGKAKLGQKPLFIAGESSGAYLVAWSLLTLRDEGIDLREQITAVFLSYGIYDLTYTPSVHNYKGRALVGSEDLKLLVDAAFPAASYPETARKDPNLSPLRADLKNLPPAFFLVGTADPALDDSIFMASRWYLEGNQVQLKVIPEGCHAFTLLPMGDAGAEGRAELKSSIKSFLAQLDSRKLERS